MILRLAAEGRHHRGQGRHRPTRPAPRPCSPRRRPASRCYSGNDGDTLPAAGRRRGGHHLGREPLGRRGGGRDDRRLRQGRRRARPPGQRPAGAIAPLPVERRGSQPGPGQGHVADPRPPGRPVPAAARSGSARGSRTQPGRSFPISVADQPVRIVFLGGLGEIGRNCACVEVDGRILILDCGLMFPDIGDARRRPGPARLHLPAGKRRPGRRLHRHPRSRGSLRRAELPAARAVIPDLRLRAHASAWPATASRRPACSTGPSSSRCATGSGARSGRSTWSSSRSPTRCPTASPPPSTPRRA